MISAEFFLWQGNYAGFCVKGHAGYADAGKDIVCAGVSASVQMTANTITEVMKIKASVTAENGAVKLVLPEKVPESDAEQCQAILKGLRLQLSQMAEGYPGCIEIRDSAR